MSRSPVIRRIVYACIVVLWIVTTSILVARHYRSSHPGIRQSSPLNLPDGFFGEKWMGIYFKGKKIGYSRGTFNRIKRGYRMTEKTTLRLTVMDTVKEIQTDVEAILSTSLSLEEFHATVKTDADIDIRGRVEGKNIRLTVKTAGGSSSRAIPLPQSPTFGTTILPALLAGRTGKGKRLEVTSINPVSLMPEQISIENEGREKVEARGIVFDADKLKGSIKGTDFFLWLSEKGELLKEESPSGFTLVAETSDEAKKDIGASADLVTEASLPFAMRLPSGIRYLKIRISGIDPGNFVLDGGRQHFHEGILEIVREDVNSLPGSREAVDIKAGAKRFLQESSSVQSKDRRIVSLANEIVGGERDPLKASKLIFNWVYRNIAKTPSVTFPSAVDVFLTRKGDCNEHTVLYTALSRAAGIPARMAAGLVYNNGRFYYHEWPEIFVKDWIALDPTLGQFPADAAHIRLVTGDIDQQTRLITVIGKIKVKGIAYR